MGIQIWLVPPSDSALLHSPSRVYLWEKNDESYEFEFPVPDLCQI